MAAAVPVQGVQGVRERVRGLTECGAGWDSGAVTVVVPVVDRA